MPQNVLNSPRLRELRRKEQRFLQIKVAAIVLLVVGFIALLTYISRNPKVNIQQVNISGNKVIDTESIEEVVAERLNGRYLKLFPKTNFLLYPKRGIRNSLEDRFKRLQNITLKLEDINTLDISVGERQSAYTWCGVNLPSPGAEEKCYFLDESGYIFDEAPYFSGEVYIKFYGDKNIDSTNPTGYYFEPKIFNKLTSFKNNILLMGLKPKSFYVEEGGDIKMFLPTTGNVAVPPEIIFKIDADYEKVAENLQAALTTPPLKSDFKNKYNSLLYIDLRFGNKVYFKFRP